MNISRALRVTTAPAATALLLAAGTSLPVHAEDTGKSFEIYGFAMVDAIQDTKRVDPNWMDAFRPSKIATPEGQFGSNGQSSISVKQSKLGVKGQMPSGEDGAPINFKLEFDFFGVGADAGQTTIRLRHAYGEWKQLLGGQTNTLLMDGDVFPNTIDYWGPAGMVFFRVPQIRWTPYRTKTDDFAVALEHASNDVDSGNIRLIEGFEEANVRGTRVAPDLTGRWRHDESWGHVQLAGMLRAIAYEYQAVPGLEWSKKSETGWGVNLSGHINVLEKDKILLQVVHGNGIATYMNDGGMDLAPTAAFNPASPTPTLSAEAVPLTGILAYYDHYWNSQFSSSIGYSQTEVTNTNFQSQTANVFHKGQYASGNLLWYPAKNVMIGGELLWGKRTNNIGQTGDDVRFQFSVKYDFGVKL
ncbi:MAG TPA: DcaP family trimeric outer membrane transporter [Steroidobacteraceae bacterium]|jgi:hypothetical protein